MFFLPSTWVMRITFLQWLLFSYSSQRGHNSVFLFHNNERMAHFSFIANNRKKMSGKTNKSLIDDNDLFTMQMQC